MCRVIKCCPYLVLLEELLILEHVANTSRDWSFLPCLKGLLCVGNCSVKLRLGGLWYFADQFLGSLNYKNDQQIYVLYSKWILFIMQSIAYWVNDIKLEISLRFNPLTIDVVLVLY